MSCISRKAPLTGKITVSLTPEGLVALEEGRYAGDLRTVRIGDGEYSMPLVINGDKTYDFTVEEDRADLGTDLKDEWYASDASTVNGESLILGGTDYNAVNIVHNSSGSATATANTHIGVTRSEKSEVHTSATGGSNAYGVLTYGPDSSVSSHIQGNYFGSNVDINAKADSGSVRGVFAQNNSVINLSVGSGWQLEGGEAAPVSHFDNGVEYFTHTNPNEDLIIYIQANINVL